MGALATAGPALSGTFTLRDRWKSCDTTKAAIGVKATFADVAAIHGPGRYRVQKEIRWDRLIGSGRWRNSDVNKTQTGWITIRNTSYDFVTSAGDRTTWGATYHRLWRARVTFKLIKERRGPINKKVDQTDVELLKGSFREIGSNCTPDQVGGLPET